jgi:hypothetical protein
MSTHIRLFLLAVSLAAGVPAFAALGGDLSSVQADRAHLQASERIIPTQNYTVHEMQTARGTLIRQFVTSGGSVFAVSWQGSAPDLEQLLGAYFDQYVEAAQAQPGRRARGVHIDTGDFVLESGGHMRFVSGRAFLRSKLPSGVTSDQVR